MLDSAGYGAVAITKSISIIAPTGVYAGIAVLPGANGVTIAAEDVNVVLRGITINGQGGNTGILMSAGGSLAVDSCVIFNMRGDGIQINADATFSITDTAIRRNGGNGVLLQNGPRGSITRAIISRHGLDGIHAEGAFPSLTAVDIADTTVDGSTNGIVAVSKDPSAVVKASVRDSRVTRTGNVGLGAESTAGAPVTLSVSNSMVTDNINGIAAILPGAKVIASGNTVTDNRSFGLRNLNGVIESAGNNTVRGNSTGTGGLNTDGVITAVGTL